MKNLILFFVMIVSGSFSFAQTAPGFHFEGKGVCVQDNSGVHFPPSYCTPEEKRNDVCVGPYMIPQSKIVVLCAQEINCSGQDLISTYTGSTIHCL